MNKINWPKLDSDHLIVYSKQMLEIEDAIFSKGMPEASLMEKVGIGISRWLLDKKNLLKNGVTIIVGPGHNGGDGAVIARELFLKGIIVSVWCPYPIKKDLTIKHINYITSIGLKKIIKAPDPKKDDLWIDAIFGSNQNRSVDRSIVELFHNKFNSNCGQIVSIDVPTGLCPNSGIPFSDQAIKANTTLSVGLKKIGILQDSAIPYVGEIHNIEIGLITNHFKKFTRKIYSISYKDINQVNILLPAKNKSKYSRGRTLLIAGSEKYPGAASLVIQGALASGVGSIKALLPKTVAKSIWQVAPEIVISDCLENSMGNSLVFKSLKKLDLSLFESIIIGPGLGIDISDWENSLKFLLNFKGILILDADALNRIAKSEMGCNFFLKREYKTFITPHFAEFKRLFPDIKGINKVELALNAAKKFDLDVLLKGAHSVIAGSNGFAWQIYDTDSDSARTGLGDLLAGFVSGMTALELASGKEITAESFSKYILLHSYSASNSINGSNASIIGKNLSRIVRKIKTGQMS
tara:strand:+ start:1359 stop:2924 length:1566 start_codon:yes stop_codon:yes gene_type:complete